LGKRITRNTLKCKDTLKIKVDFNINKKMS